MGYEYLSLPLIPTSGTTLLHYIDVIMTTMASQVISLTLVYSTVYSDAHQRKHQSSASLAFVWGIHRDLWIPRTKGQLRGICFHWMTSSCYCACTRVSSNIPLYRNTSDITVNITALKELNLWPQSAWCSHVWILEICIKCKTVTKFLAILSI